MRRRSTAGTSVETAEDWRSRAECQGEDPELFFPVGQTVPARMQAEEARAVCLRCPAQLECLAWALDNDVQGVWGATTERERKAIRRRAKRKPGRPSKEAS